MELVYLTILVALVEYMAFAALVGEQADAWQRMSRSYDRETEWGLPCDSTDAISSRQMVIVPPSSGG